MASVKYSDLLQHVHSRPPLAAIVLGSGLNEVADGWRSLCTLPFAQLPGLPPATVAGHRGQLSLCEFGGEHVLVFQGRLHFYEGHPWEAVERPVRIAAELGARRIMLTNAAGGIGPRQAPGTLMAIRGQITAMRPGWWKLPGLGGIGSIVPSPYSPKLLELIQSAARDLNLDLPSGIYAAVTGPSYETPAEIRALKILGADAVGMSTVHEANTAYGLGMEVAAISCVANRAAGLSPAPLSHAEVLAAVRSTAGHVKRLLEEALQRMRTDRST